MATITEALAIAIDHHQNGRLRAAEQIYRQILAVEPDQSDAWHLLGVIAHQSGKPDEALACYRRALELKPDYAEAYNDLGITLKAQGKLDEAVICYRRALELGPDHAEAHNSLGLALKEQGKLEDALACWRRALDLKPGFAEAHSNLGNALRERGKLDEAVTCFRRALELKPDFAQAHANLGNALKDQGKLDEAIACYRRAVALRPDFAEAHNSLGNALKNQGKLQEAVACYRRVLELQPDFVLAHNNLGVVFQEQGRRQEAIACYRRALELQQDYAEAHNNLGNALTEQGTLDEAVASYQRALELRPDYAQAESNLGVAFQQQGKLDEAVACYRRALEVNPRRAEWHSNLLYAQLFRPDCDARALHEEHCRWNQCHAMPLARFARPHGNDRSPDRRLKIGYVSPDFRDHVVGRNLLPLFRQHDHQQFEILCYADVPCEDKISDDFRCYADTWRNVTGLTDGQLAERIGEDRIDILVDLTLHMARNRLLVFARKPAPVQVTFAGYPGTTGLSAMDYRITDPYLDPPGLFEDCYAEESIRLPDSFWCYDPLDSQTAVNALPAAEKGYICFGCLNNFCKVNSPVLKMWARILRTIERSRLTMLAGEGTHRQRTLDLLAEEGVDRDRVTFVAPRPRPQYLEYYHGIDIGLDTVPYNGHTTSLDSFWMGVPVVTLTGPTVVGRAGLSQLMNLGLPELIASNPEQFVRVAAELAEDLPRLSGLRATLRGRMEASPLMDAPRFTRNVEAAYRKMWKRWCP